MGEFSGKKAVVSGATRGIGRAISEALLAGGATVIGVYGGNREAARSFQESCSEYGERLVLEQLDVSDLAAVSAFFARVEERYDTIDILINNAGIRRDAVLALMKEEEWRQVIDVNLTGGYGMCRHGVGLMLKQRYGRIIFITSPMGRMGFSGQSNYAASKAGQVGLMKSLAQEVAKRNITVNCVSPGFISTDFIDDLSEAQVKSYRKMVPQRRFGTPQEVADAVLFLAGDRAAYINGAVLEVTGGL
ncbi:3-oxoacyl-ACP reductase FabG [Desulfogranum mediterraneum]|uniref:3-oxoacyl-ACP reductase FabG n=1 Tax=Desulfogranum mediterraneum TaxID=160661 RepID=UPI00041B3255|nr:3-oxoacyl-ACP reductase FabG [Desulfogranum mediterraneum]